MMFPIPGPRMLLIGWMFSKFARRHKKPENTWYYVSEKNDELGYRIVELPEIPDDMTADEFLHWIGQR